MHCFASENQTYTGPWLLALSLVFKGQENLLLKNLQVKTRVENVRFLSWRIFFVGKYGIQSTNEMAFKRSVTLRAIFRFPAIRFDAPTLLSFSGFTHAHAKCPPVHDGNVRLPETSELHVLLRKFYMWSCSRFSLPLIFNLVATGISHFLMHRRYKIFMLFFKRNWSPLFFYLWL